MPDPTPQEVLGINVNPKQELKRNIAKVNKKYKGNPDKKDKRDKIENDLKKDGYSKAEIDTLTTEMYDELAALGMLEPRNVDG